MLYYVVGLPVNLNRLAQGKRNNYTFNDQFSRNGKPD